MLYSENATVFTSLEKRTITKTIRAHDKTYNETCVTSKDSDQPIHLPSMARILFYSSLKSLEAAEGTCDQ